MNYFHQAPFVRLLVPLVAGIAAAIPAVSPPAGISWLFLLPLAGFLTFYKSEMLGYKRPWVYSALVGVFLFCTGVFLTQVHREIGRPAHFSNKKGRLYIVALEPALEKQRSVKVMGEVKAVKSEGRWEPCSGKLLCYFQKDSLASCIRYGDCLLVDAQVKEVQGPANPGEFDYKRYLSFKQVHHQLFARSGQWAMPGCNEGVPLLRFALDLRQHFLEVLRNKGIEGEEYAVLAALMLGHTDQLDADCISAYANSGALHVLSVSGLHVGIIYVVFNFLLGFLEKLRHGRLMKAIALLVLLWFYALLTGLSPSVLRASAMCTCFVMAGLLNRPANAYNTLAVSAFFLLLIDPYLLMQVGFQLSYLAMIGILWIYPLLRNAWKGENRLLGYLWELAAVSLAAQLITFPLGLFYFGQFPVYFLPANMVVVPLSALITYLGMALLALGQVPWLSEVLAVSLEACTRGLNACVHGIDHFPGAVIDGIGLGATELVLLFGLIVSFTAFVGLKQVRWLYTFLVLMIVLLTGAVVKDLCTRRQHEFVVYAVKGHTAIGLTSGVNTVLLADSVLLTDRKKRSYHIEGYWRKYGIEKKEMIDVRSGSRRSEGIIKSGELIFFCGKSIWLPRIQPLPVASRIDHLVITSSTRLNAEQLLSSCVPRQVIIDRSVKPRELRRWKDEWRKRGVEPYALADSGAYVSRITLRGAR